MMKSSVGTRFVIYATNQKDLVVCRRVIPHGQEMNVNVVMRRRAFPAGVLGEPRRRR